MRESECERACVSVHRGCCLHPCSRGLTTGDPPSALACGAPRPREEAQEA